MAHRADSSVIETLVQLRCENGLSHMADAMRLMLNEAMRIERSQVLEAGPYQRTEKRRGYAKGFKPKRVATRLGGDLRNDSVRDHLSPELDISMEWLIRSSL